jgi:hypothetical protein
MRSICDVRNPTDLAMRSIGIDDALSGVGHRLIA